MMSVTGCFGSGDGRVVVDLPALDPRDEETCPDPGVAQDAFVALRQHRVSLVDCRNRHANVVAQYNEVRENLGTDKGPR